MCNNNNNGKNYNEIETDIRQENTKMEIKKGKSWPLEWICFLTVVCFVTT